MVVGLRFVTQPGIDGAREKRGARITGGAAFTRTCLGDGRWHFLYSAENGVSSCAARAWRKAQRPFGFGLGYFASMPLVAMRA